MKRPCLDCELGKLEAAQYKKLYLESQKEIADLVMSLNLLRGSVDNMILGRTINEYKATVQ